MQHVSLPLIKSVYHYVFVVCYINFATNPRKSQIQRIKSYYENTVLILQKLENKAFTFNFEVMHKGQ